ncbi:hypothetical protein GOARA_068_00580 [Gordonia araii NBRC 100433]|uniref:Uncharacterized protein n=1 Tax=Gordonia araii NBRC 100433 TaxID=1073574 RepID=G7H6C4_9ACTN|nr:hypothetical protein [Gordonia araii]NNG96079.1 hypothetical protein [Gordonia araii NBRC 100433]GAB11399.1 hypothetical protein GOARA_068_00580 [Gordonia araii NBRC 100433]
MNQNASGEFFLDPDDVTEFGRRIWRVADDVDNVRVDQVFAAGSTALGTSGFGKNLARHSVEQRDVVSRVVADLEALGVDVKKAVRDFQRVEDETASRIAQSGRPQGQA